MGPRFKKGTWIVLMEKLQECNKCEKMFVNSKDLTKHQKTHLLICDFCKEYYEDTQSLRKHIKNEYPSKAKNAKNV